MIVYVIIKSIQGKDLASIVLAKCVEVSQLAEAGSHLIASCFLSKKGSHCFLLDTEASFELLLLLLYYMRSNQIKEVQ